MIYQYILRYVSVLCAFHFQQYVTYMHIMAVSLIGGGNQNNIGIMEIV